MSKVFVTQYARLARDADGKTIGLPFEPSLGTIMLDVSAGEAHAQLDPATTVIHLTGDVRFSYRISTGPIATPPSTAATINDRPNGANTPEYFAVQRFDGRVTLISAIANP